MWGSLFGKDVATQKNGAGERSRTSDLLITNQLLYQLSYTGRHPGVAEIPRSLSQYSDRLLATGTAGSSAGGAAGEGEYTGAEKVRQEPGQPWERSRTTTSTPSSSVPSGSGGRPTTSTWVPSMSMRRPVSVS